MKYYLHDTSAIEDEKVAELFKEFGYEGVGLFYVILEKMAKQEKPIKTDVLKFQLKVGKKLEKCWKFMEQIGLINSNNGETFNKQLLNFSESYQIKKEKTRKKISEWRKNQSDKKNVTNYETVSNSTKVKVCKVKESKSIFIPPDISEIKNYFIENGFSEELAVKAYNYYATANWHDSAGRKLKNWKQKMQGVWFKDENRTKNSKNPLAENIENIDYSQIKGL